MLNDKLVVGVVQTSLDHEAAWKSGLTWREAVQISPTEEMRAKKEIRHFLSALGGLDRKPDIVLLPELATPLGYESKLRRIAEKLECIIVAGLDYKIRTVAPPRVSNDAVVIVPRRLNGKKISSHTSARYVGKTHGAPGELRKLRSLHPSVAFQQNPTVWLFESAVLGRFGVAVCYDFLDLDRIALYPNKIQTLFILAYNQDINTFDHVAEAISRTVFCNVVVCNCGYFGGSMAVSPYIQPFRRTIYRHSGNKLPNVQVIELPLRDLADHQRGEGPENTFKSLPPVFSSNIVLVQQEEAI